MSIGLVIDGSIRDLSLLSGGQKATALLLLLFAVRGRPLILDQPEDDLDNRFVYEDVVALLRAEKGVLDPDRRRQIIVATHMANIQSMAILNSSSACPTRVAGARCAVGHRSTTPRCGMRSERCSKAERGRSSSWPKKCGGLV